MYVFPVLLTPTFAWPTLALSDKYKHTLLIISSMLGLAVERGNMASQAPGFFCVFFLLTLSSISLQLNCKFLFFGTAPHSPLTLLSNRDCSGKTVFRSVFLELLEAF